VHFINFTSHRIGKKYLCLVDGVLSKDKPPVPQGLANDVYV